MPGWRRWLAAATTFALGAVLGGSIAWGVQASPVKGEAEKNGEHQGLMEPEPKPPTPQSAIKVEALLKSIPELKGLQATTSQQDLPRILQEVGGRMTAFLRGFPNTACQEQTNWFKRNLAEWRVTETDTATRKFRYLALADKNGVGLKEYRTDTKGRIVDLNRLVHGGWLITQGFVSLPLIFHPQYQPQSDFRYLGRQIVRGRETFVVAFAQRPDVASFRGQVEIGGHPVDALVQGVAWIDATAYQVSKMRTTLLTLHPEIRLQKLETSVAYREVQFKQNSLALWLPHEVVVSGRVGDWTFRTLHRYSDYRLFTVETEEKQRPPENHLAN